MDGESGSAPFLDHASLISSFDLVFATFLLPGSLEQATRQIALNAF